MATLKDHQQAMVDLLASGSGIPASASRRAHAMHDVLSAILSEPGLITKCAVAEARRMTVECGDATPPERPFLKRNDATTPGLNDKALSKRERALKTDSPAKWPTPAEQRVKELENTIKQLRANNAKLREQIAASAEAVDLRNRWSATPPEQAGCRKDDTQVCEHDWVNMPGFWAGDNHPLNQSGHLFCRKCGAKE